MIDLLTLTTGSFHLFGKRYNGKFGRYWQEITESQWYDEERLMDLQNSRLQELIAYAYENVLYYHELFDRLKLRPNDFRTVGDLDKLPILEKEDIRKNASAFVSKKTKKRLLRRAYTSGTTGKPLTLYRDLDNVVYEYATLQRQLLWGGLMHSDRLATLKGEKRVPANRRRPPFWKHNLPENKLVMSSYHLSKANADAYIEALRRFGPVGLEGYPSSVFALARFMCDKGVALPLRAIFTTSETLGQSQRALIRQVFDCEIFDYYGQAERVLAIHTCESGRYHILPEYGVAEFLELDGVGCETSRELVGTSLNNFAMPLLRYRIGDTVELSTERCPCGRAYPTVKAILGRKDSYLVTPRGALVGRLDHVFKGAQHIVEAQLHQHSVDSVEVRIVPDDHYCETDGEFVCRRLRERIGSDIDVRVSLVEEIPRSSSGKFQAVMSQVNCPDECEEALDSGGNRRAVNY